jgi:hypothetical protein
VRVESGVGVKVWVGDGVLVGVGGSGVGVALAVGALVGDGRSVFVGPGGERVAVGVGVNSALLHPARMNDTSRRAVIALMCMGISFSLYLLRLPNWLKIQLGLIVRHRRAEPSAYIVYTLSSPTRFETKAMCLPLDNEVGA